MTLEQATEQILQGAFRDCHYCDGTGYRSQDQLQIHDEISMDTCAVCAGKGKRHRKKYLRACQVLQREPAPIPHGGTFGRLIDGKIEPFALHPPFITRAFHLGPPNAQNWGAVKKLS